MKVANLKTLCVPNSLLPLAGSRRPTRVKPIFANSPVLDDHGAFLAPVRAAKLQGCLLELEHLLRRGGSAEYQKGSGF